MGWALARCPVRIASPQALAAFALLGFLLAAFEAGAQAPACVLQPAAGAPARQILHCRDGLTIEAEAGANYTLLDSSGDGSPDSATLRSRALLIDVQDSVRRGGFRVLTPQAIAAVRGTQWVVDVAGGRSSVFVVTGRVVVRRPPARTGVRLGPGEGVDVEAGTGPLTVRRWPAARANALLARFGR
ncbi:FecR domain-containing protein [Microvirga roseola]|uniref:FecR domain-containing protein n=1 Tax=Microvirga roseola TaxID=2883126 RepID=UPI001E359705|nr:FecR domain-containing protein [Microvirga roseola]